MKEKSSIDADQRLNVLVEQEFERQNEQIKRRLRYVAAGGSVLTRTYLNDEGRLVVDDVLDCEFSAGKASQN